MTKSATITNSPEPSFDICYRVNTSREWLRYYGLDTGSAVMLCEMLISMDRHFRIRSRLTGEVLDSAEESSVLLNLFYNRLSDRCGDATVKHTDEGKE